MSQVYMSGANAGEPPTYPHGRRQSQPTGKGCAIAERVRILDANGCELVPVEEAPARWPCIGRTKFYALLRERKIEGRKLGSRTLIVAESVGRFLASLPPY